jgi:SAM-dependent methyltransferase
MSTRIRRWCRWVGAVLLATAFALPVCAQAIDEIPFITTPDQVTRAMLTLAGVGREDTVLDLGSGDGRIVIVAARRHGARGMGVEIDPTLVARSNENARRAGVADRVRFVEQDLFKTDLTQATVITMYLLPDVNLQLRPSLLALKPGTRVVSHDWDMGDWPPDRTVTVPVPDKVVGREKFSRVHLWVVPAQVQGLWCGDGGAALHVAQRYQRFRGTLGGQAGTLEFDGAVRGARLRDAAGLLELEHRGGRLRVVRAPATLRVQRGVVFERATGLGCPR